MAVIGVATVLAGAVVNYGYNAIIGRRLKEDL
jgi:hypothetical protein